MFKIQEVTPTARRGRTSQRTFDVDAPAAGRARGSLRPGSRVNTEEKERKSRIMWKPNQPGNTSQTPNPEPARPAAPQPTHFDPNAVRATSPSAVPAGDQATIGKGLIVKGEVTGSESLFVDGKVEGTINLPGNRVTVGRNGQVSANITAREIIVLGKVRGNVNASDRLDIRSEGSLTGDVTAQRISIEDGAFFKGGIDIRKPGQDGKGAPAAAATTPAPEAAKVQA